MLPTNFIVFIFVALIFSTSCRPEDSEHLIIETPNVEDSRYWQIQVDFLSKLIRKKPKEVSYYFLRAKCLMQLSQWQDALSDMRLVVTQSTQQPEYWLLYAQIAREVGEKEETWAQALTQAEKLGCQLPLLWQMLGEYYLLHQHNLTTAKDYLKKANLLLPNEPNIHFYLGEIYHQLADTANAFHYYHKALTLADNRLPFYTALMKLHNQSGQYKQTISLAETALRKQLQDASLSYLLAYALEFTVKNKPDTAIFWYNETLRLDSTFWKANERLAQLEISKKNYMQAIRHLEKTTRLKPDRIEPYLQLASLYEQKILNLWMAQKYYLAAYRVDSLHQEAIRGKNRIEWKLKKGGNQ